MRYFFEIHFTLIIYNFNNIVISKLLRGTTIYQIKYRIDIVVFEFKQPVV